MPTRREQKRQKNLCRFLVRHKEKNADSSSHRGGATAARGDGRQRQRRRERRHGIGAPRQTQAQGAPAARGASEWEEHGCTVGPRARAPSAKAEGSEFPASTLRRPDHQPTTTRTHHKRQHSLTRPPPPAKHTRHRAPTRSARPSRSARRAWCSSPTSSSA